jgi:hypothetical protein
MDNGGLILGEKLSDLARSWCWLSGDARNCAIHSSDLSCELMMMDDWSRLTAVRQGSQDGDKLAALAPDAVVGRKSWRHGLVGGPRGSKVLPHR